ncbi:MAG: protein translocase subunit SecD [Bdellovibrionales bacterium]
MMYIERWQKILTLAVCLFALLYAAPNVMGPQMQKWLADNMPSALPSQTVNLGLDLRGGSHLLLQVDIDVAVKDRMAALVDEARAQLRREQIGYTDLAATNTSIGATIRDAGQVDAARKIMRNLLQGMNVEQADNGRLTATLSEDALKSIKKKALEQSIEIVRRRIDETGTREPSIQQQGEDRILVQLPGVDDPERMKELIGKTAKLTFRFVDSTMPTATPGTPLPPGTELLPDQDNPGQYWVVDRRVIVTGDTLVDAQPSFTNGMPVVSFRFDNVGARRFGQATTENVNKLFAIVLDNKVLSAPVIREPITGGSGQISGSFDTQAAQDLALLLRAGALPAPLTVLEERTVGPGLGSDSIRAGATACLVGLGLVIVFMMIVYGRFGVYGTVALLVNLALIMAVLSALQATLTLPGIAGIVLTIGMAVDANVLVFERMREEAKVGRTVIASIDAGYNRAWTAIVDANVTTLIAAMLLYLFGTGPVKGFAVTLTIGIVTSLFSALMLTKLMIAYYLQQKRPKELPI